MADPHKRYDTHTLIFNDDIIKIFKIYFDFSPGKQYIVDKKRLMPS